MTSFLDEAQAESGFVDQVRELGYVYAFGPEIAPDGDRPEPPEGIFRMVGPPGRPERLEQLPQLGLGTQAGALHGSGSPAA